MFFLILLEVLIGVVLFSELLIPAIRGTKFFPTIRMLGSSRKLKELNTELDKERLAEELRQKECELQMKTGEVVEVKQEIDHEKVQQEVDAYRNELKTMRRRRKRKDAFDALAKCPNLVPLVVMGGQGTGDKGNTVVDLVDMLRAKTAIDLGLDMQMMRQKSTPPTAPAK
jgi:hypothetical protein